MGIALYYLEDVGVLISCILSKRERLAGGARYMNIRFTGIVLMPILLFLVGSLVPASVGAQTVVGPEYTLTKSAVSSLQRDERRCDYFLWTKLGGTVQRVSFSYTRPDGKTDSDAPRIENVNIVINQAAKVPTARILGEDDYRRTLWQLEMARDDYEANQRCLSGITISQQTGRQ